MVVRVFYLCVYFFFFLIVARMFRVVAMVFYDVLGDCSIFIRVFWLVPIWMLGYLGVLLNCC